MATIAAAFALLWLWERPNLARWPAGERWAFWILWSLALVWALGVQLHLPLPTLPQAAGALLQPLARNWFTPRPDPYW